MLRRAVNVGFSGGEKKRNEILQMAMLQPRLAVLDETDSGLDIDALKIVADGVNRLRSPERSMIVITHYQRLLNYIVPDVVHVLAKGRVVKSGGKELALELEAKGYAQYSGRGGLSHERRSPRHQDPGRAGAERCLYAPRAPRCRARARSPRCARTRSSASTRAACRIAASRNGNTPICAR